jgi:hypothetical protein
MEHGLNTDFMNEEQRVRNLRDAIYGRGSDQNWHACKEKWMRPDSVKWLEMMNQNNLNNQKKD